MSRRALGASGPDSIHRDGTTPLTAGGSSYRVPRVMGRPLPAREIRMEQAKLLRGLAERLERGADQLPDELLESLVRELEERADLEDVQARADEPTLPWEKVKTELDI